MNTAVREASHQALSAQALPNVRAISPYLPGKPITELAREMGLPAESIVKLASNENPLGMSPKARAAVTAAMAGIERYPDQFDLIRAIAERFRIETDQVVLGNGSNDILDIVARVFLAPGRSSVFAQHAFAVYPLATMAAGGECIVVPARAYGHDLDAMLKAIRPDTRLVWIANPNNPTGTFLDGAAIHAFLKAVPEDVVVVLDEAYNEYLPPAQRMDSTAWLAEFPNLLITRTFSKIYGLAGLRIGYALTSPVIAGLMNRIRQPFNCNNLALAAAQAALDDAGFLQQSYDCNQAGKQQLLDGLARLGRAVIPPHGNFVTFRAGDAAAINQALLRQGVIVRPVGGYGLPEWLRVTIGTEAENARFLNALAQAQDGMPGQNQEQVR